MEIYSLPYVDLKNALDRIAGSLGKARVRDLSITFVSNGRYLILGHTKRGAYVYVHNFRYNLHIKQPEVSQTFYLDSSKGLFNFVYSLCETIPESSDISFRKLDNARCLVTNERDVVILGCTYPEEADQDTLPYLPDHKYRLCTAHLTDFSSMLKKVSAIKRYTYSKRNIAVFQADKESETISIMGLIGGQLIKVSYSTLLIGDTNYTPTSDDYYQFEMADLDIISKMIKKAFSKTDDDNFVDVAVYDNFFKIYPMLGASVYHPSDGTVTTALVPQLDRIKRWADIVITDFSKTLETDNDTCLGSFKVKDFKAALRKLGQEETTVLQGKFITSPKYQVALKVDTTLNSTKDTQSEIVLSYSTNLDKSTKKLMFSTKQLKSLINILDTTKQQVAWVWLHQTQRYVKIVAPIYTQHASEIVYMQYGFSTTN